MLRQGKFLDYIVSINGISIDDDKIIFKIVDEESLSIEQMRDESYDEVFIFLVKATCLCCNEY